ncbi:MAG: helix-turn-helix domain-containing protein [Planctomycetes bacterium]|nr:helix-turn-helix domain-containing protein [Planctomycetota bacterium]
MQQKFIKLEDAAEKLGVSPDQLNGLRENGQLRAYRDGPSWKFRTDEIEKMVEEGVPEISSESNIGLGSLDEEELVPLELEGDSTEAALSPSSEDSSSGDSSPDESGLDLEIELEDTDPVSAGSELELSDLEDTVTAGASDPHLGLPDEPSDPSDSILLSEEELGESMSPSGSIIVGKDVLKADADLELFSDDEVPPLYEDQGSGASNVLSSESSTGDVLDQLELESSAGGASGFEDLEELEIDLAAESSRILSPDEIEKVQAAASQPVGSLAGSDLALDDSEVDSDVGSTDVPLLDAETAAAAGNEGLADDGSGSEIDLAGEDDLVLEDTEGSDVTLGSGDSGINLAPADSGLALDDIPLEIGGSAILSSLDLGGADSDPEISLIGSAPDSAAQEPEAELQIDEDFQLTPLSKGAPAEEGDSSSQVIALDADMDDLGGGVDVLDEVGVLDDGVDFAEDVGEDVMIAEDFASADPAGSLEAGAYAGATPVGAETPFSVGQLVGLFGCGVLMSLAGVMMLDMVRNIWSWDEPYSLSSSLIDSILGLFS